MDWVEAHRDLRRLHQSPVSVSNQLTCCQLGWKSHPIIIIEGSFLPSVFVLKQRLHGPESSLHSYPISSSRSWRRAGVAMLGGCEATPRIAKRNGAEEGWSFRSSPKSLTNQIAGFSCT